MFQGVLCLSWFLFSRATQSCGKQGLLLVMTSVTCTAFSPGGSHLSQAGSVQAKSPVVLEERLCAPAGNVVLLSDESDSG